MEEEVEKPEETKPEETKPAEAPKETSILTNWWFWIVVIIVIGLIIWWAMSTPTTPTTEEGLPGETPTTEEGAPSAEEGETAGEKSAVESYYEGITEIEPAGDEGKTIDDELKPILEKIFKGVKLSASERGNYLTYVVNEAITADDVTTLRTELETAGYSTDSVEAKQLTMIKGDTTLTIMLNVDNEEKALIDVYF